MAKFCRECGSPLLGRRFCSECGTDTQPHASSTAPNASYESNGQQQNYNQHFQQPQQHYQVHHESNGQQQHHQEHYEQPQQPYQQPQQQYQQPQQQYQQPQQQYQQNQQQYQQQYQQTQQQNQHQYERNGQQQYERSESNGQEQVPPAAVGDEATSIYKRVIATVRAAHRGDNEELAVKEFKKDCKMYGAGGLAAESFTSNCQVYIGEYMMDSMMPQLARLIPDDVKRRDLILAYHNRTMDKAKERPTSLMSTTSTSSIAEPPRSQSAVDIASVKSDKPSCEVCGQQFELLRRKHSCRKCGKNVCQACSTARMLIPPGHEHPQAKGFDPAMPQRVCSTCAPILQPLQERLITAYSNSNKVSEAPKSKKWFQSLPVKQTMEDEVDNACKILHQLFYTNASSVDRMDRSIPVAFLERAHGLAFLTVVKAGFLVTAKMGSGIVITKLTNGTWSAPSAIGTTGLGGGFEGGGEIVQVLLILGSPQAVQVFHDMQITLGAGLDLTVGPYGRAANAQASVGRGNGLGVNYSYSYSKGLFAGISLNGSVISCRSDANRDFYGKHVTPAEILSGAILPPRAANRLYETIEQTMLACASFREEQEVKLHRECGMFGCPCDRFRPRKFSTKCANCNHAH
ncbi:hypothetical protein THRCLA_07257 [Thraustotheca clavata]|uniref:FYVE-type domain-containing protein n=1 Tax=Thraustotheca clavata TaxID=74557 RepID=A0A1V9ZEV2_9STRA|nr:hypothetical protein THRCLA_07257 [Thraustotheca clavata]